MALEVALLIPDTHRPYHHYRAYNLMLRVLHEIQPTYVYLLGDYADFYCVSSHTKDPRILTLLTEEVDSINQGLDELSRYSPRSQFIYLEGNHEYRLEGYLCDKCPQLFGVTSAEHLFHIPQRMGWKYIHYGPNQMVKVGNSHLYARHEPLASSAKATASKAMCSLVYGHIHRIEESHLVGLDGTNHVCFSVGWLGDKRKDKVFDYVKGHHQWQLGFGLVTIDTDTGLFYHQKVHILENSGKLSCYAYGRLYKE